MLSSFVILTNARLYANEGAEMGATYKVLSLEPRTILLTSGTKDIGNKAP